MSEETGPSKTSNTVELYKRLSQRDAKIDQLQSALRKIATNKLTSSTVPGPLYGAGVSAGLAIAADMACKALDGADPKTFPVHPDPTGKTREPPHCPTCACEIPADAIQSGIGPSKERFDWATAIDTVTILLRQSKDAGNPPTLAALDELRRIAGDIAPEALACNHDWIEVAGKRGLYRPCFFCPKCHNAIVAKYRVGVDCVYCGNLRGDAHADDCPRRTLGPSNPDNITSAEVMKPGR